MKGELINLGGSDDESSGSESEEEKEEKGSKIQLSLNSEAKEKFEGEVDVYTQEL